jgi:uncharacterized membrane protein SpoIIM required for sporulation
MKKRITFLLFVVMLMAITLLSSCHPGTYFRVTNKRGIERYQYNAQVWPFDKTCATYHSRQPMKSSTLRMLQYSRKSRR